MRLSDRMPPQEGAVTVNFTSPFPAAVFDRDEDGDGARHGGDAGAPSLCAAALEEIDCSLRKLRTSEAPAPSDFAEGKHGERSVGEIAVREGGGGDARPDRSPIPERATEDEGDGDSDGQEERARKIAPEDFDPMGAVFDMDAGNESGGEEDGGENGDEVPPLPCIYLTQNGFQVASQKSIPTHIRQLIFHANNSKGYVDVFVGQMTPAKRRYKHYA